MCNWITFCFWFDKNVTTLHTWFWFLLFSPEMHLGRLDDLAVMGMCMFLTDHLQSEWGWPSHTCTCVCWAPTVPSVRLRLCLPPPSVHPCSSSCSPAPCGPQSSPPPKDLCPIYLQKTQAVAQTSDDSSTPKFSVSGVRHPRESIFFGCRLRSGDRKGEVMGEGWGWVSMSSLWTCSQAPILSTAPLPQLPQCA